MRGADCPRCQAGKIAWIQRYACGTRAGTAMGKCRQCGTIFTELRLLVDEDPARGHSAAMLARELDGDATAAEVAALVAERRSRGRSQAPAR